MSACRASRLLLKRSLAGRKSVMARWRSEDGFRYRSTHPTCFFNSLLEHLDPIQCTSGRDAINIRFVCSVISTGSACAGTSLNVTGSGSCEASGCSKPVTRSTPLAGHISTATRVCELSTGGVTQSNSVPNTPGLPQADYDACGCSRLLLCLCV